MISEFDSRIKPQNNNAVKFFALFMVISAVFFGVYYWIDKYKGIVGLVGLVFLVVAILIFTKYISTAYHYAVMIDSRNIPLFIVYQVVGKRSVTLCRIELADIKSITKETEKERRAHKTPKDRLLFKYTPTLFPEITYRMEVNARSEKSEILIEGTDEFADLLREYAKTALENRILCEE